MRYAVLPTVGFWLILAASAFAQAETPREAPKMERAPVRDAELEYEIRGRGEPVLLIHGSHIAGAFLPLMNEPSLANYRLLRYHRRGFADSTKHEGRFS